VRLSLAGAQGKLPVVIRDGYIGLTLGNTPSTHIIKPEPEHYPGLVAIEGLCMRLARDLGLNVPGVSSRQIGPTTCLIVARYDRVIADDGTATRIHQEDLCQALGIHPARKYQQDGGPLVRDCIEMLRDWSTDPLNDVTAFVDALIFNASIGNADAHGKNYSMLYDQAERRLAPLYDLVCTRAWPELSKTPAMKIGGARSVDAITPEHWEAMANESELAWPRLEERIAELTDQLAEAIDTPDLRREADEDAALARAVEVIEQRSRKVGGRGR